MLSSDVTTPLLQFMQKVKHDNSQVANQEINIVWKCLHDTEQLTELLYSFRS